MRRRTPEGALVQLIVAGILVLGVYTCNAWESHKRKELFASKPAVVVQTAPHISALPQLKDAAFTGFGDMDGDGVADFVQIRDETIGFGERYVATIYPGAVFAAGILEFTKTPSTAAVPQHFGTFNSFESISLADVNGDRYADIAFTVYDENLSADEFKSMVALNRHDGSFSYDPKNDLSGEIPAYFGRAVGRRMKEESVKDRLAISWVDMTHDGKADLVLYADGGSDLYLEGLASKTKASDLEQFIVGDSFTAKIPDFMRGQSIKNLAGAELNGDNIGDVALAMRSGARVTISSALGSYENGHLSFAVQPDQTGEGVDLAYLGPEFVTFVDASGDGRQDYAHFGFQGSQSIVAYKITDFIDKSEKPAER